MTTNIHYLIAGMAVLLVVIWQYSRSGRWTTGTAGCSAVC